jgi:hypothetical protein
MWAFFLFLRSMSRAKFDSRLTLSASSGAGCCSLKVAADPILLTNNGKQQGELFREKVCIYLYAESYNAFLKGLSRSRLIPKNIHRGTSAPIITVKNRPGRMAGAGGNAEKPHRHGPEHRGFSQRARTGNFHLGNLNFIFVR